MSDLDGDLAEVEADRPALGTSDIFRQGSDPTLPKSLFCGQYISLADVHVLVRWGNGEHSRSADQLDDVPPPPRVGQLVHFVEQDRNGSVCKVPRTFYSLLCVCFGIREYYVNHADCTRMRVEGSDCYA